MDDQNSVDPLTRGFSTDNTWMLHGDYAGDISMSNPLVSSGSSKDRPESSAASGDTASSRKPPSSETGKLSSSLMATTSIHHRWTYDVFVSFRGEDIRKSFIDHLFRAFKRKGIIAFRDDSHLPRGEGISSQLYRAIENSRFLVVIFSKNYASSSWCLRELVKILECKQMASYNHEVQIVFYDVKPDVVRHQTGKYAEAFTEHESSKKKEVLKWKEALTTASNLSGWDLQDMTNGHESKFIDMISNDILQKLCDGPLHAGENLVGIDARVKKMNLSRFVESNKVHMIGICGIGGIGKTTLAKAIYNLMHVHFEACSFCDDVQGVAKQRGLVQVLMQLIDDVIKSSDQMIRSIGQGIKVMKKRLATMRILIVLDGIDHLDQLEALAGSSSWFFPGSLIVITSKDKQLLNAHGVDEIYDIDFLNDDEALKLFSLYAFKGEYPMEDFKDLAYQVVQYVQGHPLALKVLGCFLYCKTLREWESEIDRLQVYPNAEIQQVLRLSFDGLDDDQQKILLDIACSLKGENKDLAANVLNSCEFFADTNIRVLVDKSLITISSTMSLQMHDLIQRMAWEIVRDESKYPGKRSRLWIPKEVCDVMNKDKVTDAVEVLVLLLDKSHQKVRIDGKAFARMNNLRILKICDLELENFGGGLDLKQANDAKVDFSGSIDFLSNELRLLYWHGYPFKFLPSSFYPEKIVVIDMSYSSIKNLWTTPKNFQNLKVMKLRHCRALSNTPDFTEIQNLEELTLEGCVSLVEVHPSVGTLKMLIVLNLRNCKSLRKFPCNIGTESLQILIISGCTKVDKLPNAIGTLKTLVELRIDGTAIKKIPSFICCMSNLQILSVARCGETQPKLWTSIFRPSFLMKRHHPPSLAFPSFTGLRLLKHLDASHCNISEISPKSISGLSCLEHLNLSGNNFTRLPENLCQFPRLTTLGLVGCKNLEVLPELPPSIAQFDAINCTSLRELHKQPAMYSSSNQSLDFTNCPRLFEHHTIESLVSMMLPQGRIYMSKQLDIVLHGNRIPEWFTSQSMGNCVKMELPSGWCYDKFRGYGICVVLAPKNPHHGKDNYGQIGYDVLNFDGAGFDLTNVTLETAFPDESIGVVGSDMIWLHYQKPVPSWKDAKTCVTISFRGSEHVYVKQCGARLVCDEDIQDESSLSMLQLLPAPPTEDSCVIHPNHDQIEEDIEDEPPTKKIRIV